VADVTGAGDTVIATVAASLAAGADMETAVRLSNIAASNVVSKIGTNAITAPELELAFLNTQQNHGTLSVEQLRLAVELAKSNGEKVVFTNGCFDILHAGHVAYLQQARALGDRLIVAINSDESVTKIKGEGRPINSLERRLAVLEGCKVSTGYPVLKATHQNSSSLSCNHVFWLRVVTIPKNRWWAEKSLKVTAVKYELCLWYQTVQPLASLIKLKTD
jgi:cytidyltransferase-like protein